MKLRFIHLFFAFVLFMYLITPAGTARAVPTTEKAVVITVNGPVVPVMASYIERGINFAVKHGAVACIIELNTPGGLYQSTQEIVNKIVNAGVPVIVYVSPQGGWAASAGTFITISAHYAAMAPGTRIGAAHPVGIEPGTGGGEVSVPTEKVTEDAAAWARSLAQLRGRGVEAAELAVRESKSYSDGEALEKKLIDARAGNLDEVLTQLNGKEITLHDGRKIIINTENINLEHVPMNLREKILLTVSTPEIAYLLFTLGMLGLIAEISHPGLIFPGVIGGLSFLLGLYGLGNLDAYWGGVLLLVLALALFVAEAFVVSHGLLGTGGVVSFIMGSLMLFTGGGLQLNPWLIVLTTIIFASLVGLLVLAVVKGQKRRVITGKEGLIGQTALTSTVLDPEGTVFFAGSYWKGISVEGRIEEGQEVIIIAIEGLKLRVKKRI